MTLPHQVDSHAVVVMNDQEDDENVREDVDEDDVIGKQDLEEEEGEELSPLGDHNSTIIHDIESASGIDFQHDDTTPSDKKLEERSHVCNVSEK